MGSLDKIRELLMQGYKPYELIKLGYPKSSVYYVVRKLRNANLLKKVPVGYCIVDEIHDFVYCNIRGKIKRFRIWR